MIDAVEVEIWIVKETPNLVFGPCIESLFDILGDIYIRKLMMSSKSW